MLRLQGIPARHRRLHVQVLITQYVDAFCVVERATLR